MEKRGPGRPRSEATRRAVLDAALAELADRGYPALTMEGIAARSGAGKQTLYRWWSGKADVVLEALIANADNRIEVPDTGDLAEDLTRFIAATFRQRDLGPVLVGLMAQAQLDPRFAGEFRKRFLARRRDVLRELFERASARGELARHADDLDVLVDVVFGVLWYRLLVAHGPLDERLGERLVAVLLDAVR